jgi:hypothetical protein
VTDDSEDDVVAAGGVSEAGHGPGAAPHLSEGSLDDVGATDLPPVSGRKSVERPQLLQVAFLNCLDLRLPDAS